MKIGSSLTLLAVGLVLAYAVEFEIPGIDVGALGAVLFYIGLLGLVVSVGLEIAASRARRPPAPKRPRRELREEQRAPRPAPEPYNPIQPLPPRQRPRDPSVDATRPLRDAADDPTRRLPPR